MDGRARFDEELLVSVLSEFAHTLAGRFEVGEVLYRLAGHVVQILDVDGTGVSVVDEDGRLRPVTAINELTRDLEAVEEAHQQGPCVDAFREGAVVVVPRVEGRAQDWPTWAAEAARQGVRAVLGVPLRADDQTLGAMNIYSRHERAWHDAEVRVAQVLADMASSYVANASELEQSRRTTEQLQQALESRIVIEQAKGVLAAELRITVEQAFVALREHSRRHGASLRAVADAVVNLGLRPTSRRPPPR